jgi:hypothetical protein
MASGRRFHSGRSPNTAPGPHCRRSQ